MVEKSSASRITGEQRQELSQELAAKYSAGASIRELAASTGKSYGFVHRVLTEADVPLRGRGGATRDRRARADAD